MDNFLKKISNLENKKMFNIENHINSYVIHFVYTPSINKEILEFKNHCISHYLSSLQM